MQRLIITHGVGHGAFLIIISAHYGIADQFIENLTVHVEIMLQIMMQHGLKSINLSVDLRSLVTLHLHGFAQLLQNRVARPVVGKLVRINEALEPGESVTTNSVAAGIESCDAAYIVAKSLSQLSRLML